MVLYAPFRLLIAAVAAFAIATLFASSSAHALLLGDAVVRSAPGAPMRIVIPLKPTPGETLETACFRLVSDGSQPSMVTARVSLERAAATPRLIVTTPNAVGEPMVRFAIEAGCGSTIRRNYALVLDPHGTSGAEIRTTAMTTNAREPGQERLTAASVAAAGPAAPVVAPAPAHASPSAKAPNGTRGVATDDSDELMWYLGAPLAMGAVALGVLFLTRRRALPGMPDWTRGGIQTGPRSRTNMSAQPVTLSRAQFTPMPKMTTRQRPDGASLRFVEPGIAANSLRRKSSSADVSMLDTLMNSATEADRNEERAVRDAWAAARHAVERDEDNDILRAIDEAERELLFVPQQPGEAAMDRLLEDDLMSQSQHPKKAAA